MLDEVAELYVPRDVYNRMAELSDLHLVQRWLDRGLVCPAN